jgi:hypothetical protein
MQTDANWGTLNSGAERRGDGAAIRSTGYNVGSKGGVLNASDSSPPNASSRPDAKRVVASRKTPRRCLTQNTLVAAPDAKRPRSPGR